jgi:hypothetical protein
MSWGRNYFYGRPYKEKFYFSEQEIDFTIENLDYDQFLLQEFFNADMETRKKISDYYCKKYGERSYEYFKKKYSQWANGNYHLTDLMKGRIISLMPQFLSEDAKYKLGVNDFMTSIKRTVKPFWKKSNHRKTNYYSKRKLMNINDVIKLYENDYQRINDLSIDYFRFDVLNSHEKKEVLEISKYILKVKLQNAFNQIKKDFQTFLPFISNLKFGAFSATYDISFYDSVLVLTNAGIEEVNLPSFSIDEIASNTKYRKYCNKYLAYEMVSVNAERKMGIGKSFLNANDLSLFYSQYEKLAKGDSIVEMNGAFEGEGGLLNLNVKIKPLKVLNVSILKSALKLLIYLIMSLIVVLWSIRQEWFFLFYFAALIGGAFMLLVIIQTYFELKTLINEHKRYGK